MVSRDRGDRRCGSHGAEWVASYSQASVQAARSRRWLFVISRPVRVSPRHGFRLVTDHERPAGDATAACCSRSLGRPRQISDRPFPCGLRRSAVRTAPWPSSPPPHSRVLSSCSSRLRSGCLNLSSVVALLNSSQLTFVKHVEYIRVLLERDALVLLKMGRRTLAGLSPESPRFERRAWTVALCPPSLRSVAWLAGRPCRCRGGPGEVWMKRKRAKRRGQRGSNRG